ncbi:GDP-mannose 4,6-dehydratase [Sphingomonas sp. ACRSK]|uniref:GDP-mannose 4,6-dehydratase n=1 Tax=Sphingomonas sp. ACRSK TaxID=2918213 RepID=UPI001EF5D585|nr:GDP-mannose 4,6-dehydratase [Sphingomonas sp. ACRSK]MCG7349506.1 GDP-mannose 4,6-dehydratase [Sphingomonas sp. ACRSK]
MTGASGFTGCFVAEALTQAGATCVPLEAELTDAAAVDRAVAEADFDRVIHLAAKAFVDARDWEAFYKVNQLGTFNLLDAIARHRPGARCVLASSAQVYGFGAEGLIAEDAPTNPANHYAISKLAMEWGARRWSDQLEIVTTRPFNYTGIGQGTEYLIPKIVSHFQHHAEVIELGNLWVKRDFGDVRAVADAYAGLATVEIAPPATLNIATGTLWSIDEILNILAELSGYRPEIKVNPAFVRANDVAVLGGDATRLQAALPAWRPRDLADTLTWMHKAR